jgi:hypothetical protein
MELVEYCRWNWSVNLVLSHKSTTKSTSEHNYSDLNPVTGWYASKFKNSWLIVSQNLRLMFYTKPSKLITYAEFVLQTDLWKSGSRILSELNHYIHFELSSRKNCCWILLLVLGRLPPTSEFLCLFLFSSSERGLSSCTLSCGSST